MIIEGFSGLSREEKADLIMRHSASEKEILELLAMSRYQDDDFQKKLESFSENVAGNFHLPYGIAPNFLINDRMYLLPMVTEESSVIAAAANAAKYWAKRGGFRARVIDTEKTGQIHFIYEGGAIELARHWEALREKLAEAVSPFETTMRRRVVRLKQIRLVDSTSKKPGYHQIDVTFDTVDAMGANFINTCLETMATTMKDYLSPLGIEIDVIMSILSNFTPDCMVEVVAGCNIEELLPCPGNLTAGEFSRKFQLAVEIAELEVKRAVTHNKGIMNGIDAVLIATGNDFRAVEANVHAWASSEGQYRSLSTCKTQKGMFEFKLKIPLALGTIGGLTTLHPLAALSIKLLGNPSASELMQITAAAGLASNFAAISSLITSGIQKGHMKMHLQNILLKENATPEEAVAVREHFKKQTVSVSRVKEFLYKIRRQ